MRLIARNLLRHFLLSFIVFSFAGLSRGSEMMHPGQTPVPITSERIRPLTHKSGFIFAGTVTGIEAAAPKTPHSVSAIRITFRVDSGIRGVATGQTLRIREWEGLWQNGQRYRLGERVFLFLYSPSKLGLTSVVGGAAGRFSINEGSVVLNPVVHAVGPEKRSAPQEALAPDPGARVSLSNFAEAIRQAERTIQ